MKQKNFTLHTCIRSPPHSTGIPLNNGVVPWPSVATTYYMLTLEENTQLHTTSPLGRDQTHNPPKLSSQISYIPALQAVTKTPSPYLVNEPRPTKKTLSKVIPAWPLASPSAIPYSKEPTMRQKSSRRAQTFVLGIPLNS